MSIFDTDQPEFEPWTADQFREALCMLSDLSELAEHRGLNVNDVIAYYADRTNGMAYDKWCNGMALKYQRIENGKQTDKSIGTLMADLNDEVERLREARDILHAVYSETLPHANGLLTVKTSDRISRYFDTHECE